MKILFLVSKPLGHPVYGGGESKLWKIAEENNFCSDIFPPASIFPPPCKIRRGGKFPNSVKMRLELSPRMWARGWRTLTPQRQKARLIFPNALSSVPPDPLYSLSTNSRCFFDQLTDPPSGRSTFFFIHPAVAEI